MRCIINLWLEQELLRPVTGGKRAERTRNAARKGLAKPPHAVMVGPGRGNANVAVQGAEA